MPTRSTATKADSSEIPDKLYFRIGEVSRLTGVKPYVLRYWETEFPGLGPKKSGTGHRLYRRKEVELALEILGLVEKRFEPASRAGNHVRLNASQRGHVPTLPLALAL
jgi:hypothetical protein